MGSGWWEPRFSFWNVKLQMGRNDLWKWITGGDTSMNSCSADGYIEYIYRYVCICR